MTKNFTNMNRESARYESPAVNVVDIQTENILCATSGEFGINPWEKGEEDWF